MNYYGLKSIVASQKKQVNTDIESKSFCVCTERQKDYVEPKFSKIEFAVEKPTIILVSAVGASGKTTTARALSADTGMPILDLAKHKPVGDNTLSGILIEHYQSSVAEIIGGLKNGTCGIIIDGIDEGRSKVTEEGFEAFLDNIVKLTKGAERTAIVVLGRGQTLMNTWCYLEDNGVTTGLIQIEPFDLEQAKGYIDVHVEEPLLGQAATYAQARDKILDTLGAAFRVADNEKDEFVAFLGYPPVLDAIATLLREENNYHKICQDLSSGSDHDLEVNLLIQIGNYLLDREQAEKAHPNFVNDIVEKVGGEQGRLLKESLYNREEQCARVLARALGVSLRFRYIADPGINQEYENSIRIWCSEHPFLQNNELRNPVFSAAAVVRCLLSDVDEYKRVAVNYLEHNAPSYLFLYFMGALHNGGTIPLAACNMLMQSCSDFLGVDADVAIDLEGDSWEDSNDISESELTITIDFRRKEQKKEFNFKSETPSRGTFVLGPVLMGAQVRLPCNVIAKGKKRIDVFGECFVSGKDVQFDSPELSMSRVSLIGGDGKPIPATLVVESKTISGSVELLFPKDAQLALLCEEHSLKYPLVKFVLLTQSSRMSADVLERYNRLRRILVDFRSHSKGALAKYRAKVEHRRVVKNDVGRLVLKSLVDDGILKSSHLFYYLEPEQASDKLGISWQDLKYKKSSAKLEAYLAGL